MTDGYAARVYPTLLYVLDLLDAIAARHAPGPADVEPRLKAMLGQLKADQSLEAGESDLVFRALVYWTDEVLANSSWDQRQSWRDNYLLEFTYFQRAVSSEDFYVQGGKAKNLTRPDALEAFFLCVSLGFQGVYRSGSTWNPQAAPSAVPPSAAPVQQAP
ncbi:MAG: DotU family type IV/VI secretion system protein, partial [Planctomycetia bacterium]